MFRRTGRVVCGLLVLGSMAVLVPTASAGTINIPVDTDCSYDSKTDDTDCLSDTLVAGLRGTDAVWVLSTSLTFDVDGSLPSGAEVSSATLHLYGSLDTGGSVETADLVVGDRNYPDASFEFEDGAAADWASWDVTGLVDEASDLDVTLSPAGDTPLIPMLFELASSESASSGLRPYLEVEYSTR